MTDRGAKRRRCVVIINDGGEGREMAQSSDGRSFQRRGAVMDQHTIDTLNQSINFRLFSLTAWAT